MAHFQEFRLASQTWRKNRPEMWTNPMLIFADTSLRGESIGWWARKLHQACDHPALRVVGWPDVKPLPGQPDASQRHRMLSVFVYGVAEEVKTAYFLKIDTDTLCIKSENRWHENWWNETNPFVFVTSAWGYSKSIDRWHRLKAWGATVPQLRDLPEVEGEENPLKDHVRHGRIISFFFWGQTEFMRELEKLAPGPLMPIDSQDGFVWYCAKRLGRRFAAVRIKKFGLFHGARGMEKRVKAIMEEK